jgi:hypothetical protein
VVNHGLLAACPGELGQRRRRGRRYDDRVRCRGQRAAHQLRGLYVAIVLLGGLDEEAAAADERGGDEGARVARLGGELWERADRGSEIPEKLR